MTTTKRTYKDLFVAVRLAEHWLSRNPTPQTRFGYALYRAMKGTKRLQEKYYQRVRDIEIDNCLTGDNRAIIKDASGDFCYTPEGRKERDRLVRELDETLIEIEPHYVTDPKDVPDSLTFIELDYFEGFVIQPEAETRTAAAASD